MSRIKVGVVGVGYLGQHHARIYSKLPEVDLVGVVDIDEGKANAIAAQAGCRAYQDFHALLDKVQAVNIAVPTRKMNSTQPITIPNMGFRLRMMIFYLNGWCWRSIRQGFRGSRS